MSKLEIALTAIALTIIALSLSMLMRNPIDLHTVLDEAEPVAAPVPLEEVLPFNTVGAQEAIFYDLGDGAIALWMSDACPEPMVAGEFCFSPKAGKRRFTCTISSRTADGSLRCPFLRPARPALRSSSARPPPSCSRRDQLASELAETSHSCARATRLSPDLR